MQESPDSRLKSAAENALLQLCARLAIIAVCATALPAATYIANRAIGTLDKVVEDVATIKLDLALVKQDISYLRNREHASAE